MSAVKALESLIPSLDPGTYTALDAIRFVRKIVKREPRRMDMENWMSLYAGKRVRHNGVFLTTTRMDDPPACGTVACVAGWINIATGHPEANRSISAGTSALRRIGLKRPKGFGDWYFPAEDDEDVYSALCRLFGQTAYSPSEVVRKLDQIMKTHRKALKEATFVVEKKAKKRKK